MEIGSVGRLAFILGLVASAGAAGCFINEEAAEESGARVTNGPAISDALKSTLVFDDGCMATKVGPRHLLTAARCVKGKAAFAAGKTIEFKIASQLGTIQTETTEEEVDEESGPADAGADARADARASAPDESEDEETTGDAGRARTPARSTRSAKIEKVEINASFTSKCETASECDFRTIGASDAKDIAVIILEDELTSITTIPVDLDTVGQSDKVIVVGSNCETFEGEATGVKTFKTMAVPAKAAKHEGSPYTEEPQLVSRLAGAYVVTPGIGWRDGEPRICQSDMGAPLFRRDVAAVTGVLSNFSAFEGSDAPVTIHHTRVDKTSRVGTWLTSLGVETTKTCSESEGGCVERAYNGGFPETTSATGDDTSPGDGGVTEPTGDGGVEEPTGDGGVEEPEGPPAAPSEQPLPEGDEYSTSSSSGGGGDDSDYDAGAKKKKKKAASGCSAAPGSMPSGGDGMVLGLGLAVAGIIARRRRSS
jgi:MYXO-CTERM domain-containing protein